MKERVFAKIVNKSKEGITLRVGREVQTLSWDNFNDGWEMDPNDKFKAWMKPEHYAKMRKAFDIVDEIIQYMHVTRLVEGELKLATMALIGEKSLQLQALLNLDAEGVQKLVLTRAVALKKNAQERVHRELTRRPHVDWEKREEDAKRQKPENPTMNGLSDENLAALAALKSELDS